MCIYYEHHVHAEPEEASVPAPADEVGPFDGEPQPGDPYTYPEVGDTQPEGDSIEVVRSRLRLIAFAGAQAASEQRPIILSTRTVEWLHINDHEGSGEFEAAHDEAAGAYGWSEIPAQYGIGVDVGDGTVVTEILPFGSVRISREAFSLAYPGEPVVFDIYDADEQAQAA